jgi:hypothetical protein
VAITTAVVVPHPPLLIPELGRDDSPALGDLRSACLRAVTVALERADALLLVGGGPAWSRAAPGAVASFAPYGAAVEVALPVAAGGGRDWLDPDRLAAALPRGLSTPRPLLELPLSLAVAAWLLAASGQVVPGLAALAVPAALDPTTAAALGRALAALADSAGRVSLLAMGDLSARRTPAAPGAFHPAAAEFDQRAAQAIRDAAPSRLLALDPALAARLRVAGLVSLQVLAGALAANGPMGGAARYRGEVLYEDAPYGVGYLVATLRSP